MRPPFFSAEWKELSISYMMYYRYRSFGWGSSNLVHQLESHWRTMCEDGGENNPAAILFFNIRGDGRNWVWHVLYPPVITVSNRQQVALTQRMTGNRRMRWYSIWWSGGSNVGTSALIKTLTRTSTLNCYGIWSFNNFSPQTVYFLVNVKTFSQNPWTTKT